MPSRNSVSNAAAPQPDAVGPALRAGRNLPETPCLPTAGSESRPYLAAGRALIFTLLLLAVTLPATGAEPELVARSRAAWQLLKDGKTAEGAKAFAPLLDAAPEPLARAAAEMARRWLTRVDREQVKVALRRVYTDQVAYPAALLPLEKLPAAERPPLADRWGAPWVYKLTNPRFVKGVERQSYTLESKNLPGSSDLGTALRRPYGGTTKIELVNATADAATLRSSDQIGAVILSVGSTEAGLTLAYADANALVVSNGDYWFVLARK